MPVALKPTRAFPLLVAAFLPAGIGFAQNLATNPGFENGTASGWSAFGPCTIAAQSATVHAGSYAGRVQNRTNTWHGLAQSFQGVLQAGQTYNLSVWVRLTSGAGQTVQLTLKKTDGSGTTYSAVASGSVTTNDWTQLAGQYTLAVSGSLSDLTLYLEVPSSATAGYYADDLMVEAVNSTTNGTGQATVNWNDVHQRIDGFGASSAWRPNWTATVADMFFSTNSGLGLSLLRTRITPGGSTVENSLMQLARDRGARVWSSPWSPPTALKTTNANGVISVNGGGFNGTAANYQAYASQLAGYVAAMKSTYGVNLYAISVQNEPDFNTTNYESCVWTGQQIHDFVPYLAGALAASNVGSTRIIIPESEVWNVTSLYTTTMNDANVAPLVSIIANHNYAMDNNNGDQNTPAALNSYGKALWETEVSTFSPFDGSMTNGLYWAKRIHSFLTVAEVNAWHYWWLSAAGSDNSGLASSGDVLAKRGYVLGQYSRFVRPDFYRIGVLANAGPALVSAFKDPGSSRFAIVAINPATYSLSQTVALSGFTAASVTPWITSASLSLASQAAVGVTNGAFVYALPAWSVVTFVGQANTPPVLTAIGNQAINAGVTLVVTNRATDPEAPPQNLTYSLLAGPTNATLLSSNGVLTWRPLVRQAATTNLIKVAVADSGSPSLSATNSFTVTVNPLAPANLTPPALTNSAVALVASGTLGPDYTLQSSSNLVDWQPLFTTNPLAMPFLLSDTNPPSASRFYRLLLGP